MDIEIQEKKQNPLLARTEVRFVAHHQGEQTPTRDAIREKVAALVNSKKSLTVVDHMNSVFGKGQTHGYARVYENPETLGKVEPIHLLKRNKLEDLKPKKKVPQAAPAGKGKK